MIACPNCGSTNIIKKGKTGTGFRKLCKECGKYFVVKEDDLTNQTTPTVNEDRLNARKRSIADTTVSSCGSASETIIDFSDDKIDTILALAKKDANGNFLLRIGNNAPVPIGSSQEELHRIVMQNGNCKLAMSNDGLLTLTVNTTTKG